MGREENVMRGYRAAIKNPNNSNAAKMHAQTELAKHEGQPTASEEDRHAGNVKRGLTAATHNPNVTDEGKQQARNKLEAMGEAPERPAD